MQILILIQIIKSMPPYWDNKALPTPTLTLPYILFSTFWLFSLSLLKNKCFSDCNLEFEKEKKIGKRRIRTRVDRFKRVWHTLYHLHYWSEQLLAVLCNID